MLTDRETGATGSHGYAVVKQPPRSMARYKAYDYNQTRLIPVSLDHQLLPGTLEHAIHVLVENKMDLSMFDGRYKNDESGCKAYDPKILLKVVLFAYSRGFVGSRRIEWLCRNTVTCMALACMQCPDHSTIAAFVSSIHGEILLLFRDILQVCDEQQLLGGTVFALDGLKLSSNASKQWSGTLEELKHKQEKLEAKIEQLLVEHQQVDAEERGAESSSSRPHAGESPSGEGHVEGPRSEEAQAEEPKTEEVQIVGAQSKRDRRETSGGGEVQASQQQIGKPKRTQKNVQQKRAERLKRLRRQAHRIKEWLKTNEPKIGKQGKEIQSNVTDNESAKMSTSHGVLQGYNGQALVDAEHQVILYAEAFGNGQDYDHVSPMIAGAKATMQALGHGEDYFAETIFLADSNYHSDDNLKSCAQEHLDAYIPDGNFRKRDPRFATQERYKPPQRPRFIREDFRYEADTDRYICPNGKELRLEARADQWGRGVYRRNYRRYMSREGDCQACPLRAKCLRQKGTKRRNLGIPVEPVPKTRSQQMIEKIDTEEGRKQYSRRVAIVEPVFGNIRVQKRLDRFPLRGKQKVNSQWLLYSMVHNIEKIASYGVAA
jgi:transposase